MWELCASGVPNVVWERERGSSGAAVRQSIGAKEFLGTEYGVYDT
jgi:hypothetical protein